MVDRNVVTMEIEVNLGFIKIKTETSARQGSILCLFMGTGLVAYALSLGYDNALLSSWMLILGIGARSLWERKKK